MFQCFLRRHPLPRVHHQQFPHQINHFRTRRAPLEAFKRHGTFQTPGRRSKGWPARNQFVQNNPNAPHVGPNAVRLPLQQLRGNVPGRATDPGERHFVHVFGVFEILDVRDFFRQPKITQFHRRCLRRVQHVSVGAVHHNVVRFDVRMQHAVHVQVPHRFQHLVDQFARQFFAGDSARVIAQRGQGPTFRDRRGIVRGHRGSSSAFHHQPQLAIVLVHFVQPNDVRVVQPQVEFDFSFQGLFFFLAHQKLFFNAFGGKETPQFTVGGPVNSGVGALPQQMLRVDDVVVLDFRLRLHRPWFQLIDGGGSSCTTTHHRVSVLNGFGHVVVVVVVATTIDWIDWIAWIDLIDSFPFVSQRSGRSTQGRVRRGRRQSHGISSAVTITITTITFITTITATTTTTTTTTTAAAAVGGGHDEWSRRTRSVVASHRNRRQIHGRVVFRALCPSTASIVVGGGGGVVKRSGTVGALCTKQESRCRRTTW